MALWSPGAAGVPTDTYLDFADDSVDIAPNAELDLLGGSLTISAWINPRTWGQNDQGRIVDHGGGSNPQDGWSFYVGTSPGTYDVEATSGSVVGAAAVTISTGSTEVWPGATWETATPAEMNMDAQLLAQARDYAGGSGMITRGGKLVMSWGDQDAVLDLKSTTKSFGSLVVDLAIQDGLVDIDDLAEVHLPTIGVPPTVNSAIGWLDDITIRHLLTHTAGFDKPGGFIDMLFAPGTAWSYTDGGANWLADIMTVRFGEDLSDVMFNRVFNVIGVTSSDLTWRNHQFRDDTINGIKRREFGAGISANVNAMARVGYLLLRGGEWNGQQLLRTSYVQMASTPAPEIADLPILPTGFPNATAHYGLLWWNNGDGTIASVPTDTFWSWGLFDSVIVVIPSLDIVSSRAGTAGWRSGWDANYTVIAPFLVPIATSVRGPTNAAPTVEAGAGSTITLPDDTVNLDATVSDDGLPSGTLDLLWDVFSGPGPVTFGDATAEDTTATFTIPVTMCWSRPLTMAPSRPAIP